MSASQGPANTAASAAESASPDSISWRRLRRGRRIDQVGQQAVGRVLHAVAAVRPVERQDQRDLARELVDAVDARQPLRVEELDRGRLGVLALGADHAHAGVQEPADQPDLELLHLLGLTPAQILRAGSNQDRGVQPLRVAGELRHQGRAEVGGQVAPAREQPPRPLGRELQRPVLTALADAQELLGERIGIGWLLDAPDQGQRGAGRVERALDVVPQDRGVDVAEADQRDVLEREPVGHHSGRQIRGEPLLECEVVAEVGVLGSDLVEVRLEVLLEPVRRTGDDVASQGGADQDPHRQRDEDRCERGDVVAGRVAH